MKESEFAMGSGLSRSFSFVLLLAIFFCEVGVMSITDVQPNFLLLSLIGLGFWARSTKINVNTLTLFCICSLSLLMSFIVHQENVTGTYVFKYIASLITVFSCYLLCSNQRLNFSNKFLLTVGLVYFLVAFIQFIVPEFLTSLISRQQTTVDLRSSGRGMMSLTGEPSHFGKTVTIINILYVFKVLVKGEKLIGNVPLISASFILFLLNCALSQSFYACFFHFACLLVIVYMINRKLAIFYVGLTVFGVSSLVIFVNLDLPDLRVFSVLTALLEEPEVLLKQGAALRVFNIPLNFYNLTYFGVLGSGNSEESFKGLVDVGIGYLEYHVWNRLYGGFIEYVLKMGILSVPLVTGYIYMFIRISRIRFQIGRYRQVSGFIFSSMLLVLSLQDGSPASPLMIFASIYVYVQCDIMLKHRKNALGPTI